MKTVPPLGVALALSLLSLAVSAQVAPSATPAVGAAATPAKKVPLSSADKQLVKSASEVQLGLIHLTDVFVGLTPPGSAPVQKLAASTKKTMNDAWGEGGTISLAKGGEMVSTVQTPAEKKELADLKKLAPEKFDKGFLKAFSREAKRANAAFTSGSKFASDPELKAFFVKFQPLVAKVDEDALAAETEAKKAK